MHKYLSLTKVLLKSGFGVNDAKNKKWFKVFIYGILAICFLPVLGFLYVLIDALLPLYARIDQTATLMGAMLFLTCFIIFIFSLFMIPSIFYFSSDIETLLALPLKSEQIIGSKFTVCLIWEYLFSCGVLLPTYAAYVHYGGLSMSFLFYGIPVILLIPIYPLVLSTLFTILLMRFVPFFKNRDRFNLISSILLVVLGLGFSFFMNTMSSENEREIIEILFAGNNSLLALFMKLFPMVPYFSRAIVDGTIIDFLIGMGICLLALLVFLTFGKFLYFKGVIGSSETGTSFKTPNHKQIEKASRQGNKIWTYVKKDIKIIYRTPAYFTNCLCTIIIFPVLLIILPLMGGSSSSISEFDLSMLIAYAQSLDSFPYYVIFFSLGAGLLFGTINQIASTAISREGSQYFVMKYLPMSYRDQIHAKALCGILVGFFGNLLMISAIAMIIPLSWYYIVIYLLCSMITTVLGNELGIMIDLVKPKLVWEQEASAVKQNLGSFLSLMISMAICVLLIVAVIFIPSQLIATASIASVIISLLGAMLAYVLAGKYAEKVMKNL